MDFFLRLIIVTVALVGASAPAEEFKVTTPKESVKAPKTLPTCARPQDFSVAKDVAAYERCVELQDKYCDIHDSSSECKKLGEDRNRRIIRAGSDVDTSHVCAIQHDSSYKCATETIRFTLKEDVRPTGSPGPSEIQPLNEDGTQGPPPTAAPGTPGTPGAPAAPGTEGNPNPFIPPPPPPGYVPPAH